jgi:hypothetical protein
MTGITVAYDVTSANLASAPHGAQLFGYDTGSGGIAWSTAQWAAHPGAGHIDQDPAARDATADVLDVENGAVPPGSPEMAAWVKRAKADFAAAVRPGQREPAIYCSESNVTTVVNGLIAGGVTSGVSLWIADWSWTEAQSVQDVINASGPFPIVGVQFADAGAYDCDVFSTTWLDNVSGHVTPPPPPPAPSPVSVTPHLEVNASWPVHAGASEYTVTFTSMAGKSVSTTVLQPAAGGAVHLQNFVIPSAANMALVPGVLAVHASVGGTSVLVGTFAL